MNFAGTAVSRTRYGPGQILLLGALSAVGPIGVDIYLPAFPVIAADLGVEIGTVQLSMAVYFLALGLGQLPYGILSDRIGRKGPILLGLGVFVAGSLACAMGTSAAMLIGGRFVQGMGISAILSVSRAIIRDMSRGGDAAHIAARMLLIVSISPLLAPMMGSAIIGFGSWRTIFWLMAAIGALMLVVTLCFQPETHTNPTRHPIGAIARQCGQLLCAPAFVLPMLLLAAAQAGASVYLGGSPSVYLVDYGVSPWGYSLAFACNAAGMILLAQANRRMIRRLGMTRTILTGVTLSMLPVSFLLMTTIFDGSAPFPWVAICFFLFFSGFGLVMGPASVLALEDQASVAGVAAGLIGLVQFVSGAVATTIIGQAGKASLLLLLTVLVFSQGAALLLALFCAYRRDR